MTQPGQPRPTNVVDQLTAYRGFRFQVGGGAAFFLGLLTAGLYPGLAVITRMRRHRAEESGLYFRVIDHLRRTVGRLPELDRAEVLANRMLNRASGGVIAILVAIGLSLAIIGVGPAIALIEEEARHAARMSSTPDWYSQETPAKSETVVVVEHPWGKSKGGGKPMPPAGPIYPTGPETGEDAPALGASERARPIAENAETLTILCPVAVAGLVLVWATLALGGTACHRGRTVAILRQVNAVASARNAPTVRVYPAGLTGGQIFWLILVLLFSAGIGLGVAAGPELGMRVVTDDDIMVPIWIAFPAVVWGVYVLVAMLWSNHARRWNERVFAGLAETVSALTAAPVAVAASGDQQRYCTSPSCGAPNLPVARYCGRCGKPL